MSNRMPVLLVEDTLKNIEAAQQYFQSRPEVDLDIATDFREGLKRVHDTIYGIGLFDVQLPRTAGQKPELLGVELAKHADKYHIPQWALVTSGIDHHNTNAAFVSYSWDPFTKKERSYHEITETPKSSPESWRHMYERLVGEEKVQNVRMWMQPDDEMLQHSIEHYLETGQRFMKPDSLVETMFSTPPNKLYDLPK